MFKFLKNLGGAVAGTVSREINLSYGVNKDFLEAACAASALVAAADGTIDASETTGTITLLTNHATLGKLYKPSDIAEVATRMFSLASSQSGKQSLARELDDIKSKPNADAMAQDVYYIAADVAAASGDVDAKEEAQLVKIAGRLGINPDMDQW